MKAKAKLTPGLTLGLTLGFAVLTQVAHAADFNPQPDPPGKVARVATTIGQHNPPGDKGTLIDPKVNVGVIDPNERVAKGAVIGLNDKGAKGVLIDPNEKKH